MNIIRITFTIGKCDIGILDFYNIHSMSNVTEGGILGLTLLLEYWFGISPSVSGMSAVGTRLRNRF